MDASEAADSGNLIRTHPIEDIDCRRFQSVGANARRPEAKVSAPP